MLLKPTHEITFSGLPKDILDTYVRYKKGTRAIVCWLAQYAPDRYSGVKSLPLKELDRLAKSVTSQIKSLPDIVHFYFRETIAARDRLSKYFRQGIDTSAADEFDTVNHEHFTTSLAQIYAELCECCGQPVAYCQKATSTDGDTAITSTVTNRFAFLNVEDMPENHDLNGSDLVTALPEQTFLSVQREAQDLALADDELDAALEFACLKQSIQDHFSNLKKLWIDAAQGRVTVLTAAFMANVHKASLERVASRLIDLNPASHEVQQSKKPRRLSKTDTEPKVSCLQPILLRDGRSTKQMLLDDIFETSKLIQKFIDNVHEANAIDSTSCPSSKPTCYALTKDNLENLSANAMVSLLSNNILNLVGHKSPLPNIIRSSSPTCQEHTLYLAKGHQDPSTTLCCAMSQHILSTSYHTYLNHLPQLSTLPTCRLSALRLAQSASTSILTILDHKSCFPCRCPDTLAYHLDNFSSDLQGYTKHRCWDFYHQSPWVAGNHMLEMLDIAQYYGMRLFRYRHFVGAVLHTYNVLEQLAGLDKIPLLEELCEQFKDVFFPGGERPRRNFCACWTRYIGARIKFQKGHRRHDSKEASWCMAVPAYAARAAAGLGVGMDSNGKRRLDEMKDVGSLLFQVKREGWLVTEEVLGRLTKGNDAAFDHRDAAEDTGAGGERLFAHAVAVIDNLFTTRAGRVLPEGLINHFAIFGTCLDIIGKISTSSHGTSKDDKTSLPSYCICFATSLLQSADRIIEGRRMGRLEAWKKHERELVELVKNNLVEVMNGVECGGWTWKL